MTRPQIKYNDAWEMIPLEFVDDVIEFLDMRLQPTHPLRQYELLPIAKCWRKEKYLIEEEKPSDKLWCLDLERKRRVKGRTCYYFKLIESQEELDEILEQDYRTWVQHMKEIGSWNES